MRLKVKKDLKKDLKLSRSLNIFEFLQNVRERENLLQKKRELVEGGKTLNGQSDPKRPFDFFNSRREAPKMGASEKECDDFLLGSEWDTSCSTFFLQLRG